MTDSRTLLAEYTASRSETAFRELVERYINLVYSTARRLVAGDAHLAQDVTQIVFTDLARKAPGFSSQVMLGGWLHQRTFHVATTLIRAERRRQRRERRASEMNPFENPPRDAFVQIAPALDEAILQLKSADRQAILLRFFEQKDFHSVGEALGSNEDAARMRVNRALEKLHALLKHRGFTLSAAALGATLGAHSVTAAPLGLAASISGAALASAAATGTTFTLLKLMAMTKVQIGVTAIILTGAAITLVVQRYDQGALRGQTATLQQQIAQLQKENANLLNRASETRSALKLNLPAPRLPAQTRASESDFQATNLITRLQRGEKAPTLTPVQVEKYLKENHRSASSLLAAFRATGDQTLLKEATEQFPNDPQVAFTAAYAPGTTPEDRTRWLAAFKESAPENSMANYLSALDHFKAGRIDQAIADLSAAAGKQKYQDYSWDFIQGGQEAYRSAGYSEAEARIIPSMALVLPQLAELKQLNEQMVNLATAYRQAGDEASAQAALQMDAALGQRLDGPGNLSLITQLVGMAIESMALKQMDPNAPYGDSGQTVKNRLEEVSQRKTTLAGFAKQLDRIYETISAPDWISYHDRWLAFGEDNAITWLLDKYGQK
jgi:RNA polymerase sigma factor (sigma-70 family)